MVNRILHANVPGSSTRADETTTDDQGNSTTISYLYSMSPLLGPGCQEWTAQGEITIFNNFTRSIDRVSEPLKHTETHTTQDLLINHAIRD